MKSGTPGAGPDEASNLAREIAGALAAVVTPLPPGAAAPAVGGHPVAPARGAAGGFDLSGSREMLDRGARFVSPVLPPDASMHAVKKLVLRALRIVTRDQTVFNSAVAESLRIAFREVEAGVSAARADALRRVDEEAERASGEAARAAAEWSASLDRARDELAAEISSRTERLGDEISRSHEHVSGEISRSHEHLSGEISRVQEVLAGDISRLHGDLAGEISRSHEDLGGEISRSHGLLGKELERVHGVLRGEVDSLGSATHGLSARLEGLETAVRLMRLEWTSLRTRLEVPATGPAGAASPAAAGPAPSQSAAGSGLRAGLYAEFEEAFRGTEEEIARRQRGDAALFAGAPGPVADLGCGRGEFLTCLLEQGTEGIGVDSNPVLAARARERGVAVAEDDLFCWLRARADASLGGITAFQVVEHLPPASLVDLVELAAAKLAPGGRLLLETVNPESVWAMRWFWADLTHVRPVPGPTLAQLLRSAGFRDVVVDYRSPVPPELSMPPGAASDPALAPVADLLFGPQDVAVTGVR